MCVPGVEQPPQVALGTLVDAGADELDAQPVTPVLPQDVDIGEVRHGRTVGDCPREADLTTVVVDADDALGFTDEPFLLVPRSARRPVRVVRHEVVDSFDVDPLAVVVDFEAARELPPHAERVLRRKPPWYS